MNRFWRDPEPAVNDRQPPRATTLAHLGGASAADFTRTETRELFLAVTAAINGGARTKADVLAALPEHLREYATWIDAAGAEQGRSVEALPDEKRRAFAVESVTALRMKNVRQELDDLTQALMGDGSNQALLKRVGELAAWLRDAGKAFPRADGISRSALGREKSLPNRAPIERIGRRVAS